MRSMAIVERRTGPDRRKPYLVNVSKEGRWVLVEVPELGVVSQALVLSEAADTARDLIAGWLDVNPARIRVRLRQRSSQV